jgi:hypothetical protein
MQLFINISVNQWKTKQYHTVGTILKSNRKTKNTTLSEQLISQSICQCQDNAHIIAYNKSIHIPQIT